MIEKAFKVCIFGESGVGKTTLTHHFLTGEFSLDIRQTIGAQIFVKYFDTSEGRIVLQFFDFGGEDSFRFLLPSYAAGSSAGIFMLDISDRTSLRNLELWLSIYKEKLTERELEGPIFMVGGKLDLSDQREINPHEAIELQKRYNLFEYIECSSKTNENVYYLFQTLVTSLLRS